MGLQGLTRIYIGTHGFTWVFMGIQGYSCVFIGIQGYTEVYMGIQGYMLINLFIKLYSLLEGINCSDCLVQKRPNQNLLSARISRGREPPYPYLCDVKSSFDLFIKPG